MKSPLLNQAGVACVTPLPPYTRLFGPVTQNRIGRLLALYAVCLAAGSALQWAQQDAMRILGLGLLWPGGGFMAHADICTASGIGHVAMAVGAAGLFGLSLLIWFGTGNIVLPPLAWMGTAWWAALMPHGPVLPGAVTLAYGVLAIAWSMLAVAMGAWFVWAGRQRHRDNAYLASQAPACGHIFTAPMPGAQAEMSLAHVQRLRFALDRALQPEAEFAGFELRDQFQTAALRYQLHFLGYGIALTQARFTPAFAGYMHEAQRRLIHKQARHGVWSYWALENMWGNLRVDADPTARENIMFTGFTALQMSLFEASTGRSEWARPGSFYLQHPRGQRYPFDLQTLLQGLEREYARTGFYLIACEPNWVYPLCNTMGACALLSHDTLRRQSTWARHAQPFRQHLEAEFLDGSGSYVPCRSARTGLALPAIGGVMPQAMPCYFLNALAPDLARRQWLLLRRRLFDQQGRFRRRAFWPIDTGNYALTRASAYTATALAAAELGDEQVHAHCLAALEDECPSVLKGGVMHRAKASVWSHGVELMALANGRDGFRALITSRLDMGDGPRLGNGLQTVEVEGLRPGWHYSVTGASVSRVLADGAGKACLQVMLKGRTGLCLAPDRGDAWRAAS